jgi:hypothetical protein
MRRDVAQLGSALPWGGRGREFKSHRSDHLKRKKPLFYSGFCYFCSV